MSNQLNWTVAPDESHTVRISGTGASYSIGNDVVQTGGLHLARRLDPESVLSFANRLRDVAMRQIENSLEDTPVANPDRVKVSAVVDGKPVRHHVIVEGDKPARFVDAATLRAAVDASTSRTPLLPPIYDIEVAPFFADE